MLNNMYTLFDDVTQKFDVYKVATIGDAYMVVSGIPVRNDDRHAAEICNLALALRLAIQNCFIPHSPGDFLMIRIGIHSGSCVAGVAGVKMPRYLLFGDTVDIASKVESHGESMKIQITGTTKQLIHRDPSFIFEKKDHLYVKQNYSVALFMVEKQLD